MERPRTTATYQPEPEMTLHAEMTIDTRLVVWETDKLSLNERKGKHVNTSRQTALWRGLGARAATRVRSRSCASATTVRMRASLTVHSCPASFDKRIRYSIFPSGPFIGE